MQSFAQLPLSLNVFEVLRTQPRSESCCTYPRVADLVVGNENGLQWYFYSKLKAKVLRRKKQNVSVPKLVQYVVGGEQEHNYNGGPACILVSFQQAGTIVFNLYGKERTIQFLRGTLPRNFILVFLKGMNIEKSLIRAYWTQNYCMCEKEELLSLQCPNTDEEYVPTAATKQYIADASLSLSLIVQKSFEQERIREMNLLFIKDKNFPVPLLVAAYAIKTESQKYLTRIYNNYKVRFHQPISQQQSSRDRINTHSSTFCTVQQPRQSDSKERHTAHQPSSTCFQCSTCKDVFSKEDARRITRNSIHKVQVRNRLKVKQQDVVNEIVEDNQLIPDKNRRLFLLNYNQVEICPTCYEKFTEQVRSQQTAMNSNRRLSLSRKILRRNNYSCKERSSEASDTNSFMNMGHFKRPLYINPLRDSSCRSKQIRTRTSVTREEDHDSSTVSYKRGRTIPAHFNQQL